MCSGTVGWGGMGCFVWSGRCLGELEFGWQGVLAYWAPVGDCEKECQTIHAKIVIVTLDKASPLKPAAFAEFRTMTRGIGNKC